MLLVSNMIFEVDNRTRSFHDNGIQPHVKWVTHGYNKVCVVTGEGPTDHHAILGALGSPPVP